MPQKVYAGSEGGFVMECLSSREFETVSLSTGAPLPAPKQLWRPSTDSRQIVRAGDFMGLELSLVPEVEKVFVDCIDKGKEYRVLTVVNDRDPAVRAQIYKREQAIMSEFKHSDFDFQIVARQNRCLAEILNPAGVLAFKR
jgi:hypothetical protein